MPPITLKDIGISTVQDKTDFALVVQLGRETITLEFVLI